MNSNIISYLNKYNNINHVIIYNHNDLSNLKETYYIEIKDNDFNRILEYLDNIYYKIKSGGIIHFYNWFDNIDLKNKGPYDAFNYWLKSSKYILVREFPIHNWNEKAYIIIKEEPYEGWSD